MLVPMWLSDSYEVPQELVDNPPSPEFRRFLLNWFGSNRVDNSDMVRSATCLAGEELTLARDLMRRNLKTRHTTIINGTWILGDMDAIPLLREMFENEPNESRRLTIAGALWKLCRDPVFIECLNRVRGTSLMVPHMDQVLWLDDERAVDFLIDLLPADDRDYRRMRRRGIWRKLFGISQDQAAITGRWALGMLNRLETGPRLIGLSEGRPPSHYRELRNERGFRDLMVEAVHKASSAPPRI